MEADNGGRFRPARLRWLAAVAAFALVGGIGMASVWPGMGSVPAVPAGPSTTPGPTYDPVFDQARLLPDAPDDIRDGRPLARCGEVRLDQDGTVDPALLRCLTAQYSGLEGAELVVAVPTTEGDPIVHFFVHTTGPIRKYVSNHRDTYAGTRGWTATTCPTSAAASWRTLLTCVD